MKKEYEEMIKGIEDIRDRTGGKHGSDYLATFPISITLCPQLDEIISRLTKRKLTASQREYLRIAQRLGELGVAKNMLTEEVKNENEEIFEQLSLFFNVKPFSLASVSAFRAKWKLGTLRGFLQQEAITKVLGKFFPDLVRESMVPRKITIAERFKASQLQREKFMSVFDGVSSEHDLERLREVLGDLIETDHPEILLQAIHETEAAIRAEYGGKDPGIGKPGHDRVLGIRIVREALTELGTAIISLRFGPLPQSFYIEEIVPHIRKRIGEKIPAENKE